MSRLPSYPPNQQHYFKQQRSVIEREGKEHVLKEHFLEEHEDVDVVVAQISVEPGAFLRDHKDVVPNAQDILADVVSQVLERFLCRHGRTRRRVLPVMIVLRMPLRSMPCSLKSRTMSWKSWLPSYPPNSLFPRVVTLLSCVCLCVLSGKMLDLAGHTILVNPSRPWGLS